MAFCSNCGTQVQAGKPFCAGCGAPISTVTQQQNNQTQYNQVQISGDGKHVRKRVVAGFIGIVYGLAMVIIVVIGLNSLSSSYRLSKSVRDMLGIIGPIAIIGAVAFLGFQIYLLLINSAAMKTNVNAGPNMVAGNGLTGKLAVQSFNFPYSDIINIDVVKNPSSIVIHTTYTSYKCHVSNPDAIRAAIMNNKNTI